MCSFQKNKITQFYLSPSALSKSNFYVDFHYKTLISKKIRFIQLTSKFNRSLKIFWNLVEIINDIDIHEK